MWEKSLNRPMMNHRWFITSVILLRGTCRQVIQKCLNRFMLCMGCMGKLEINEMMSDIKQNDDALSQV